MPKTVPLLRALRGITLATVAAILCADVAGQEPPFIGVEQDQLLAIDGGAGDYFGYSVAISSDGTAVIGSTMNAGPHGPGAAYIYVLDEGTWVFQEQIAASHGIVGDKFGISVDIDGDTIVVGANGAGASAGGAAYVFTRDGAQWVEEAMLTAPDASSGDYFGWFSIFCFVLATPHALVSE